MTDVHPPEVRSFNMSQIKSKGTKPEELVRKPLFSEGFRYRKIMLNCLANRILYCQSIKQ